MTFYYIGATIQLGVAGVLLFLAPRDVRHQSFAALIGLNAIWDVLEGWHNAAEVARRAPYFFLVNHLSFWTVAALAWFLSVYPKAGRWRHVVPWAAFGTAAAASLWLLLDRTALVTVSPTGHNLLDGPLALFRLGWFPLLVAGAAYLLYHAHRARGEPRAWTYIIVALALLVYPLARVARRLDASAWGWSDDLAPWGIIQLTGQRLAAVAALPVALAALYLATQQTEGRAAKAILASLVVLQRLLRGTPWGAEWMFSGSGAIMFGLLVGYALARTQLFDLDLKLKLTLSRGTVLMMFASLFLIVSQVAQLYFQQGGQNYILGGIACGLLLFVYGPLQRMADRFADRAMPGVQETPEYVAQRKHEIYAAAYRAAQEDGILTEKERRVLAALADKLDLKMMDVSAIERQTRAIT